MLLSTSRGFHGATTLSPISDHIPPNGKPDIFQQNHHPKLEKKITNTHDQMLIH
jgi:hypothetical protein